MAEERLNGALPFWPLSGPPPSGGRPRKVKRLKAATYVEDETDIFIASLQSGAAPAALKMLEEVSEEDKQAWVSGPLDAKGLTALHYALGSSGTGSGQLNLVSLLCSRKADPNAKGPGGVTPFHLCVQFCKQDVIKAMLRYGADNKLRTDDGKSTVQFAQCNPDPIETFEVVGWPTSGPLDLDKAGEVVGKPELKSVAADWTGMDAASLRGPLLLTALWFIFLAMGARYLINNV
eukprot:TRINITY_DN17146_c0_g4_i1.p1 TRINITY_DN17146_c0_g4~~TRINITY_DN17146_c0_g4_i1.p1  ORF type:complete len:259 (-),score=55.95 TRINITY_DN17146_c0_g4_i1:228-929(-)